MIAFITALAPGNNSRNRHYIREDALNDLLVDSCHSSMITVINATIKIDRKNQRQSRNSNNW